MIDSAILAIAIVLGVGFPALVYPLLRLRARLRQRFERLWFDTRLRILEEHMSAFFQEMRDEISAIRDKLEIEASQAAALDARLHELENQLSGDILTDAEKDEIRAMIADLKARIPSVVPDHDHSGGGDVEPPTPAPEPEPEPSA